MTSRFNQQFKHLSVSQVRPSSLNPRADVGDVTDLAESIRAKGIVQPLTVRAHPTITGDYEVIAGHRRLAAAKEAGLLSVPCVIDSSIQDDKTVLQTMLIENIQRAGITKSEEASAIQGMLDLGMNLNQVAKSIGRKHETVESRAKLANMSDRTKKLVDSGNATLERVVKVAEFERYPEIQEELEKNIDHYSFDWEYNRAKEKAEWEDHVEKAYDCLTAIGFEITTPEEVRTGYEKITANEFREQFSSSVVEVAALEQDHFTKETLENVADYRVVLNHSSRAVQWYKASEEVEEAAPSAEELAEQKLREGAENALRTSRTTFEQHAKDIIAKPKKIKAVDKILARYIVGMGYRRKDVAELLNIEIPEGVSTHGQVTAYLIDQLQKFTTEQLALALMLTELGADNTKPFSDFFRLNSFDLSASDYLLKKFSREVLAEATGWQESPGEKLACEYWEPQIDTTEQRDEVNF